MKINAPEITTCPALDDNWVITEDFSYEGHGVKLTIPRGFVTDLASIPRCLWRVIAPFELSLTAPIIHDLFYRADHIEDDLGMVLAYFQGNTLSRETVDRLFLSIMEDEGVSWWRRTLAFRGVRMFGGSSWGAAKVQVIALEGE